MPNPKSTRMRAPRFQKPKRVEVLMEESDFKKAQEKLYMRGDKESVSSYIRRMIRELIEED